MGTKPIPGFLVTSRVGDLAPDIKRTLKFKTHYCHSVCRACPLSHPWRQNLGKKNRCVWRVCSQGHSWRECHAHSGNNTRSKHIGVCEPFLNISSPRANSETSGGQSHAEGRQIHMMQRGEIDTETTGRWARAQGAFLGSPEVPRRRRDAG